MALVNMKMIPVPMGPELIAEMMVAMKAGKYTNRSEFIRDAIVEKAQSLGLSVPEEFARPPMRVNYPAYVDQSEALNDKPVMVSADGKPLVSVAKADLPGLLAKGAHPLRAEVSERSTKAVSTSGKIPAPRPPVSKRPNTPRVAPAPVPAAHES